MEKHKIAKYRKEKVIAVFLFVLGTVKNYCPMQNNPLVHELEIQDHKDSQDKDRYDETDDPLVSIHSPHHASNYPPALTNVVIHLIQLQCQIRIAQQGVKKETGHLDKQTTTACW